MSKLLTDDFTFSFAVSYGSTFLFVEGTASIDPSLIPLWVLSRMGFSRVAHKSAIGVGLGVASGTVIEVAASGLASFMR